MRKWEYLVRTSKDFRTNVYGDFESFLDSFGEDGWELVAVVDRVFEGDSDSQEYYFKRELDE
ncbi:MAG: hypothetical protein L6Q31_05415 [Fimbriimonadaceae bacterium]|nr:hypothetical protein [Fimbriimonadaceae bacterium]NUM39821.1 hypothetical protein [Armatimonadota bacterium]